MDVCRPVARNDRDQVHAGREALHFKPAWHRHNDIAANPCRSKASSIMLVPTTVTLKCGRATYRSSGKAPYL
jgi:hypothetical protein